MSDTERTPRILITRLSAIGDCILTFPLACALRDRFPDASLVWAVEPLAAGLVGGHQAIDATIVVPKGWLKSPRAIRALRAQLRAARFDWVIDPQSLTKSSLLGWLSGAPYRIGFAAPQGRELARWVNNVRLDRGPSHLVDASLKLLAPLGIEKPAVRFDVPSQRDAEARVDRFLREAHLTGGYIVINSAASWRSKQWPPARFGRVARYLGEQHNLPTVVTWAGHAEAVIAGQIIARAGGHAVQAPGTNLLELAALLRRARLVLGSDTGPLHLAVAVGSPCIGLYGPTRVENSGPYGAQHITLQVECPPVRNRRRRMKDDTAMRLITVEAVCQACDEMLRRPVSAARQTHAA